MTAITMLSVLFVCTASCLVLIFTKEKPKLCCVYKLGYVPCPANNRQTIDSCLNPTHCPDISRLAFED